MIKIIFGPEAMNEDFSPDCINDLEEFVGYLNDSSKMLLEKAKKNSRVQVKFYSGLRGPEWIFLDLNEISDEFSDISWREVSFENFSKGIQEIIMDSSRKVAILEYIIFEPSR